MLWLVITDEWNLEPVKDMLERDKTPVLVMGATIPSLYDPPGLIFSYYGCAVNWFTGLAKWVLQDWEASGGAGRPKLGVMHWDNPFGNSTKEGGGYTWAEEHGVDVIDTTFSPTALDLSPQLLRLRDEGVDYVYLFGRVTDVTLLIRNARGLGLWDDIKFIITPFTDVYHTLLPLYGEDAEGLYMLTVEEPWTAGPEVAKAHRISIEIDEWAGKSGKKYDMAASVGLKQILSAVVRQAVADVGYDNLSGEAMYNALQKLEHIDTLGSYHNIGWGPDERVAQSGIKMLQLKKMAPGSPEPPDGIMMETVAVSDWIETINIFEGEW
jgi:ABC-type branched-subunit amino acid transport system substrate-binding protein